ncbi:unnamed protein product [Clavelina lepadiformis]|uniref:Uncharacterized protein n=1 Tax=Clavelina lepadiformis TaxID=159417 RepID=A0ABP0FV90_CLALP
MAMIDDEENGARQLVQANNKNAGYPLNKVANDILVYENECFNNWRRTKEIYFKFQQCYKENLTDNPFDNSKHDEHSQENNCDGEMATKRKYDTSDGSLSEVFYTPRGELHTACRYTYSTEEADLTKFKAEKKGRQENNSIETNDSFETCVEQWSRTSTIAEFGAQEVIDDSSTKIQSESHALSVNIFQLELNPEYLTDILMLTGKYTTPKMDSSNEGEDVFL